MLQFNCSKYSNTNHFDWSDIFNYQWSTNEANDNLESIYGWVLNNVEVFKLFQNSTYTTTNLTNVHYDTLENKQNLSPAVVISEVHLVKPQNSTPQQLDFLKTDITTWEKKIKEMLKLQQIFFKEVVIKKLGT
jgi:hypothetical protein